MERSLQCNDPEHWKHQEKALQLIRLSNYLRDKTPSVEQTKAKQAKRIYIKPKCLFGIEMIRYNLRKVENVFRLYFWKRSES